MHLAQNTQIVPLLMPVDLAGGANTGDWVNMENFDHITIVYVADIGTAGEDPVITVLQAQDNAATGSKALNFTQVYQKEGATAINAVGVFTKITGQSDNTYSSATGGENEQLIVIEIDANQLDMANDFTHVSVTIADAGTAGKLGCVLAILHPPRYAQEIVQTAID